MDNFLKHNTGRIILSIILGLGLAALFKKVCLNEDECEVIKFKIPNSLKNSKEFISNLNDNNCYKFTLSTC